jgi:hypothetical protein
VILDDKILDRASLLAAIEARLDKDIRHPLAPLCY